MANPVSNYHFLRASNGGVVYSHALKPITFLPLPRPFTFGWRWALRSLGDALFDSRQQLGEGDAEPLGNPHEIEKLRFDSPHSIVPIKAL